MFCISIILQLKILVTFTVPNSLLYSGDWNSYYRNHQVKARSKFGIIYVKKLDMERSLKGQVTKDKLSGKPSNYVSRASAFCFEVQLFYLTQLLST